MSVNISINPKSPSELEALPTTVDDLLTLLDQAFPNVSPKYDEELKDFYYRAGQRSVVNWVFHLQERTE